MSPKYEQEKVRVF